MIERGQNNTIEDAIQNPFPERGREFIDPRELGTGEQGTLLHNLARSQIVLTANPDSDLQKMFDSLEVRGGGGLFLKAGTYTVESNITVPSAVSIVAENPGTVIIEFNSTSAQFLVAGTDAYDTGTVSASDTTTIVGSGTSWLANVTPGHQIYLVDVADQGGRWHRIAQVVSDTQLILAEPLKRASIGTAYRAAKVKEGVIFEGLTIKNSTGAAIDFDDVRNVLLRNVVFLSNGKGFTMDHFSFVFASPVTIVGSTGNGYELTNGSFFTAQPVLAQNNGGHGAVLNTISFCTWNFSSASSNTNDGFNCTDLIGNAFIIEASFNGANGIQFVSGCKQNNITTGNIQVNTDQGIELAATSDNNIIRGNIVRGNNGFDIRIAAATCDDNIILGNQAQGASDSGTGTLIRSNIGVADN